MGKSKYCWWTMDSVRSNDSMVVVARLSLAITLYYGEKIVIWNDFKSNHKISNQIQIKSHVFQIKSLFLKSNHYVWFNHDLNQIMIWICPSLLCLLGLCVGQMVSYLLFLPFLNSFTMAICKLPFTKPWGYRSTSVPPPEYLRGTIPRCPP